MPWKEATVGEERLKFVLKGGRRHASLTLPKSFAKVELSPRRLMCYRCVAGHSSLLVTNSFCGKLTISFGGG